jgi:asparagine synthase (glutamine-hydrolysing)
MRGIAGCVGIEAGELAETVLRRMGRQVGSGGEEVAIHGAVGLVRPFRSADGRYLMAYEGELYNEPELGQAGDPGGPELVLAAWASGGAAALDRCNGRFALAILDTTTGELTLARDPAGCAPLYLAADGSGRVAFASEIRAVLAAGLVPRRPDDLTVYRYLALGVHEDTERTFFDRVTRLLPGELAVVSPAGEVRRETYTRLYRELDSLAAAHRPAGAAAREQVASEVTAAVERRMASEAPVGTSLAGTPDLDRLPDDLPELIGCQQEPVGSLAAYADYCLMREASRQVSVLVDRSAASELVIEHLRQAGQPPLSHRLRRRTAPAAANGLFGAEFAAAHRHVSGPAAGGSGELSAGDLFRRRLPAVLRYQDRNGTRFAVRRREPYLDPSLLRALWSLDQAALRGVTGDLLPPAATRLPEGWPAPLADLAEQLFGSERFAARPYADQPAVLAAYRDGELDPALGWRLVNLELWLRAFVDRDPTLPPASTFVDHYQRPEPGAEPTAEAPAEPVDDDLITVDAGA